MGVYGTPKTAQPGSKKNSGAGSGRVIGSGNSGSSGGREVGTKSK